MNISIACDHGAFDLKERLKARLASQGHQVRSEERRVGKEC